MENALALKNSSTHIGTMYHHKITVLKIFSLTNRKWKKDQFYKIPSEKLDNLYIKWTENEEFAVVITLPC